VRPQVGEGGREVNESHLRVSIVDAIWQTRLISTNATQDMTIPSAIKDTIRQMVAAADEPTLSKLRTESEAAVMVLREKADYQLLSRADIQELETAIEVLANIDMKERGKGTFYLMKRRIQLAHMYMR
jgi:hypothetical protein